MLNEARKFNAKLYPKGTSGPITFPVSPPYAIPPLDDKIMKKEYPCDALTSSKCNITPRSDGLTTVVYTELWDVMGDPFAALVNQGFTYDKISKIHEVKIQSLFYVKTRPGRETYMFRGLKPL